MDRHPNFLPSDKQDLESCEKLRQTPVTEIIPYLSELLEWLQDINWPVALPIADKLSSVGYEIVPCIDAALKHDDSIWKSNVIEHLIMKLNPEVMEAALIEVVRIVNNPTKAEIEEEVNLIAREAIFYYSHVIDSK